MPRKIAGKRSTKRTSYRNSNRKYMRGQAAFIMLIAVVIIGAILFVGGIAPKNTYRQSTQSAGTPDVHFSNQDDNSLQLKTFGFKKAQPTHACLETAAVDFLVDTSGSMRFGQKLQELESGLDTFANDFPAQGVVGLQEFAGPGDAMCADKLNDELVPIGLFSQNKDLFLNQVHGLNACGSTYTREGFKLAQQKLSAAMPQYPNQKFNLIVITDGIPETDPASGTDCHQDPQQDNALRCFATSQDPTTNPDIAAQIKSSGVRIFTIAYLDQIDSYFNADLEGLMTRVASSPSDFYKAPTSDKIPLILSQITQQICNE